MVLTAAVCLTAGVGVLHAVQRGEGDPSKAASNEVRISPRVTSLDIDLTLDPDTGLMVENARIEVDAPGRAELTFAINPGLTVERVRSAEGHVEFRKAGDRLRLIADPPLAERRSFDFRITGTPRRMGEAPVGANGVLLSPDDAWYPVFEQTWARAQVRVHAPEGWTAIAPGRLHSRSDGEWIWRSDAPVRSLALAAAPGLTLHTREDPPVPITITAAGDGTAAAAWSDRLSQPLAWMSAALAPYPFDAFHLVRMPGTRRTVRASGLVVIPADAPLASAADGADIVAGQWFGERVAGDGVWIDAFAAWQATVYSRDRGLELPSQIDRLRDEYLSLEDGDVPLTRADASTSPAVVRGKGSIVPDMIRLTVGDRRFFAGVQSLMKGPIGPELTLAELRAIFEEQAGLTMVRTFSDWFEKTGAPEFRATLRTIRGAGGDWRADLTLEQLRGVYALPVEVVFHGAGRKHREVIRIEEERTSVFYILPFEPQRVEIDPLNKLFMVRSS